jgi:hypothetical protein
MIIKASPHDELKKVNDWVVWSHVSCEPLN